MAGEWWRRFAVRGIIWRRYLDFALTNVPFYLRPVTMVFWIIFFFFFAAPARRAILSNLKVVLPGSSPLANLGRAWLTLYNFGSAIADAADHKLAKTEFAYEVEGGEFLDQLASAHGAILLTAHMGNYDLGAAVFAQRFRRDIRMVRAPEADGQTAQHLDESLERAGGGAVKVAYNTFITMKVRSSYCSASRIQWFISAAILALISSAGRDPSARASTSLSSRC
jgi:predicted LPLAT superfamily acyltransferase